MYIYIYVYIHVYICVYIYIYIYIAPTEALDAAEALGVMATEIEPGRMKALEWETNNDNDNSE